MAPKNKKKNKQATDGAQTQTQEDAPEVVPQADTVDTPPIPKIT